MLCVTKELIRVEFILRDRAGTNTRFQVIEDSRENFQKIFGETFSRKTLRKKLQELVMKQSEPFYPDFCEIIDLSVWTEKGNVSPYKGYKYFDNDGQIVHEMYGEEWFFFHAKNYFAKDGDCAYRLRKRVKPESLQEMFPV